MDNREGVMEILLANSEHCLNEAAITQYVEARNSIEAEVASGSPQVQLRAGRVACLGCRESADGTYCTVEVTQTAVSLRGQPAVAPQPETSITPDLVSGFIIYRGAA